MEDVNISIYRASVVREGSTPASPGFVVSDGQNPVDPSGSGQNHLPVTIAEAATGLSITESQVLGGAGTVGQYIRGDGSLADFPESSGGGSSVSYYLNGSVSQGTIGGVAYKELNKVPILGAGTDFTINADGYIASFLTDAGDPNLLEIPGGNWNFETYFSASSSGGTPSFYVELYKYNGTTFTLIASSSTAPEFIAFGTTLTPYFSTLAVPTTTLALTDRLAIRYYVTHSGRTITLHTENNHLCQIITTFTTGITALNGLTAQVQNFAVGTSGTDFNIASATATHTFNLPTASATNRGALSSADWSMFNGKQNALTNPVTGTGASGQVAYFTGTSAISSESNLFWDATNDRLGIGAPSPLYKLDVRRSGTTSGEVFSVGNTGSGDFGGLAVSDGGSYPVRMWATQLEFYAGNSAYASASEAMRIFSSTNVHIGPTPASDNGARLQVSGTASIGSSTYKLLSISDAGGAGWATTGGASTSPQVYLFSTGTSALVQTYINNVSKLEVSNAGISVNGSITSVGVNKNMILGSVVGATGYNFITLNSSLSDGLGIGLIGGATGDESLYVNAGNNGNVVLRTGTGSTYNTRIIVYGASGNVGIGTTSLNFTTTNRTTVDINGTNSSLLALSVGGASKSYMFQSGNDLFINNTTGLIAFNAETSNIISFATSNQEAMRIFSSRNVHIGPTPASDNGARLQVSGAGGIRINATTGTAAPGAIALSIRDSGNPVFGFDFNLEGVATGDLYLMRTNSGVQSTVLQIARASGIATFSSAVIAPNYVINRTGSDSITTAFYQQDTLPSTANAINMQMGASGGFQFWTFNGSWNNRMSITSSGNVGIGTASPDSFSDPANNLVVGTTSGNNGITIAAATNGYSSIYFADGTTGNEAYRGYFEYSHSADFLGIGTAASERMRITSGGSVGINNTSPVNTAWGNETNTKQLSIDASDYAVLNLQGSTGRKYSMGVGDGNFYMCYDNTAGRHNITVSSGGNVLIGTTNSGLSKLRLVGLPTSSAGLLSGDVWSDSGTLKIA